MSRAGFWLDGGGPVAPAYRRLVCRARLEPLDPSLVLWGLGKAAGDRLDIG